MPVNASDRQTHFSARVVLEGSFILANIQDCGTHRAVRRASITVQSLAESALVRGPQLVLSY